MNEIEIEVWGGPGGMCSAVTVSETLYGVGYERDHRTGNYIATCNGATKRKQEIVILPGAFHRALPEVSRNVVAGYVEVNDAVLVDLGFVLDGPAQRHRRTVYIPPANAS